MGIVRKVGIIGVGHVGAHVANSLVLQGIADEIHLCDLDEKKLAAECMDISDSLAFCPHNVRVVNCGVDYEELACCDVIVNAAGNVSLAAVNRDGELFYTSEQPRTFAKQVTDAGFEGIWVSIANPCDVVATAIWRLSGCDPRHVIGSGTALDSSRFRHVLSEQTGIDQKSISCYMLGEHGNSQFAVWSEVNFGGKPLAELERELPGRFALDKAELEQRARSNGYVTMAGKHCTEYAIADAGVRLVRAVVSNEHTITACSTLLTGQYGEQGHFISLPCIVGADGVEDVIELSLTDEERESFHKSCAHVQENISKLAWLNA